MRPRSQPVKLRGLPPIFKTYRIIRAERTLDNGVTVYSYQLKSRRRVICTLAVQTVPIVELAISEAKAAQ